MTTPSPISGGTSAVAASALPSSGGSAVGGTKLDSSGGSGGTVNVSATSRNPANSGGSAPVGTSYTATTSGGTVATTAARTNPSASGGSVSSSAQTITTTPGSAKYAVIIKAAGYLKSPGVDTLTGATSEPYNTHVFADALAEHLRELKVTTNVVAWVNCTDLSCVRVPDSGSTAAIVVFAGPMYNSNLPDQLQALVPKLGGVSPRPKVTSALASCNECTNFTDFIPLLKDAGLPTVPSVFLNGEKKGAVTDASMHAAMSAFAQALVQGS